LRSVLTDFDRADIGTIAYEMLYRRVFFQAISSLVFQFVHLAASEHTTDGRGDWRLMGCRTIAAPGSARGNTAERTGEQVLLARRQWVKQQLADRLCVHRRSQAEHLLPGRGDGDQDSAPVIYGTGPPQPATVAKPGDGTAQRGLGQRHRCAQLTQAQPWWRQ
jgi:hypothetical protein